MAFGLKDGMSVVSLWRSLRSTEASFLANPDVASLAPRFNALAAKAKALSDQQEELRFQRVFASAQVRVHDARADDTFVTVFRTALVASNMKPKEEPLKSLFGDLRESDLTRLGAAKAGAFAAQLAEKLASPSVHPSLAGFAEQVRGHASTLRAALDGRVSAEQKLIASGVEKVALIDEVERVSFEVEAELLTRFPGRRAFVRALIWFGDDGDDKPANKPEPAGPDNA